METSCWRLERPRVRWVMRLKSQRIDVSRVDARKQRGKAVRLLLEQSS